MTPVEKVIAQIVKLCEEYHVKKAILFGSRAKGTALERSDIDIAVSGVPDQDALLEEIPTLYKIDLVDLDSCKNALLKEDIERYGRKIYEKI